jgi:acetyltransferase-like isoleucine patch superfamily enzyme
LEQCKPKRAATILCGIGNREVCLYGAGSVVTKRVDDYTLVIGNPAPLNTLSYPEILAGRDSLLKKPVRQFK